MAKKHTSLLKNLSNKFKRVAKNDKTIYDQSHVMPWGKHVDSTIEHIIEVEKDASYLRYMINEGFITVGNDLYQEIMQAAEEQGDNRWRNIQK